MATSLTRVLCSPATTTFAIYVMLFLSTQHNNMYIGIVFLLLSDVFYSPLFSLEFVKSVGNTISKVKLPEDKQQMPES